MMKIEQKDGKAYIYTPYNADFVIRIKKAGGKWDSSAKAWVVKEGNVDAVRTILRAVYGGDDLASSKKVRVRVALKSELSQETGPIQLFGKVIASAFGRDSGAKLDLDVFFEKGSAKSGGSAKYWKTIIENNSVFCIDNVPLSAIEAGIGWNDDFGAFEILEYNKVDTAALEREKELLLKRLSEIEEELKKEC